MGPNPPKQHSQIDTRRFLRAQLRVFPQIGTLAFYFAGNQGLADFLFGIGRRTDTEPQKMQMHAAHPPHNTFRSGHAASFVGYLDVLEDIPLPLFWTNGKGRSEFRCPPSSTLTLSAFKKMFLGWSGGGVRRLHRAYTRHDLMILLLVIRSSYRE